MSTLEVPATVCPPRFGTLRDTSRQTLGHAVGKVAKQLGKPLMPWQQYVADVTGEIDPDTGRLWYQEALVTVPRQSGKSTLVLAKASHRSSATGFFGARQQIVYTAQTRNKAREKFIEDYAAVLEASPTWRQRVRTHWGNGNEHIRYQNGSRFAIESATEKAGHGGTLDEAYIDEAFAHQDDRLEQAFEPAMITRPSRQMWIVSTAGWLDGSPYLLDKVQVGRSYVESGEPGRLAVFEWSAHEDDDPTDEDVWRRCMPALGTTIRIEAVRSRLEKAERSGNLNGFRRAYLNQWTQKDAPSDPLIDMADWGRLVDVQPARPNPVAFGVEVSPDRKWSQIAVAGLRTDGNRWLQVVKSGRGTGWVAPEVARLADEWKPIGVGVDASGPAGSLIPAMKDAGVKVSTVSGREFAGSCGAFMDAITEGTIRHDGSALLRISLEAATKRPTGGAWALVGPADGSVDIAPLKAVVSAMHVLATAQPKRTGRVW